MNKIFVNIGYGNVAVISKIIALVKPDAAPIKRIIAQAKEESVMSDGYLIASALQVETIVGRIEGRELAEKGE